MDNELRWFEFRHYEQPPEQKTTHACYSHGRDHGGYGWGRQADPRWSDDQRAAYLRGYVEGRADYRAAQGG